MFANLNDSALTAWLNSLLWGFPSAEIFHIVMTGAFFGGIAMLDLRLLGVHRAISARTLMQHILPCLWWLFAGVILSGALLFMFMPLEYAFNPAFRLKLVLIALGGINALVMHLVLLRSQVMWDSHSPVPGGVKLAALASLAIWIGTLACGRLIAYYYGA
ncbi:MAG TPA: hypothetical protein VGE69_00280 [Pseudomonadales bacterium]